MGKLENLTGRIEHVLKPSGTIDRAYGQAARGIVRNLNPKRIARNIGAIGFASMIGLGAFVQGYDSAGDEPCTYFHAITTNTETREEVGRLINEGLEHGLAHFLGEEGLGLDTGLAEHSEHFAEGDNPTLIYNVHKHTLQPDYCVGLSLDVKANYHHEALGSVSLEDIQDVVEENKVREF